MAEMAHTKGELKYMQSMSLSSKIQFSNRRLQGWFENWVKYKIINTKTGKVRYVTWHEDELPKLRKNEELDNYDTEAGQVYVSFSGGKDSTVLADLAAKFCKAHCYTLYLLFVNTGLEYPEIQKHVKYFAQWLRDTYEIDVVLDVVRPEMRFDDVIKTYGYPIISKEVSNTISGAKNSIEKKEYSHRLCKLGVSRDEYGGLHDEGKYDYEGNLQNSKYRQYKWRPLLDVDFNASSFCCNVMKKNPAKEYEKTTGRKPIVATLAEESDLRENAWFKNGCNAFEAKRPMSQPLSFWTNQDILLYIKQFKIPICSVYGEVVYEDSPEQTRIEEFGVDGAGVENLKTTGCDRTGCIFCAFGCHMEKGISRFEMLKQTHPRQYKYCIEGGAYDEAGIWKPSKEGLGMGHVFDELNKIYGDDFIKY